MDALHSCMGVNMKKKRNINRLDAISGVGLTIHTKYGESREIPLEVWQVGAICDWIGLQVKICDDYSDMSEEKIREQCANIDKWDYNMLDETTVKAKQEIFYEAAKKLPIERWDDYWEYKESLKEKHQE